MEDILHSNQTHFVVNIRRFCWFWTKPDYCIASNPTSARNQRISLSYIASNTYGKIQSVGENAQIPMIPISHVSVPTT